MEKKSKGIKKIAVVGAGTMGSGIAQLCAQAGFETVLFDVLKEAVMKGSKLIRYNLSIGVEKQKISEEEKEKILSRIKISHDFNDLKADVIIEAIIENLELKSELFTKLAAINKDDSIFCTNTSSIPITKIAENISHPQRVVGMHFFNPAHLMKLVEIVSGKFTSKENAQTIYKLAIKLGKEPVMVNDAPGFIVNRIGKLFHTEPLKILEEKIASVETIDSLLIASGFKMGPFRLIDLIGVDANLNVTKSLYELFNFNSKFKPSNLQQQMVDDGLLGKKTGKGFYQY
ncbi:MAG: 3-hydroxybutyryl-CoA dehydrogenase [Chitinophagales bacterium]|nr:3-hydroxybutyryl-CoA dehydrogenase [Chitinophagales bacterium]